MVKKRSHLLNKRIIIILGIFVVILLVTYYYPRDYKSSSVPQRTLNETALQVEPTKVKEKHNWLANTTRKKERFFVKDYDNASYYLEWESYEYIDDIQPEEKNNAIFNANVSTPIKLIEVKSDIKELYEQQGIELSNGYGDGSLIKVVDDKDIENIQMLIGRSGTSAQDPVQINLITKKVKYLYR